MHKATTLPALLLLTAGLGACQEPAGETWGAQTFGDASFVGRSLSLHPVQATAVSQAWAARDEDALHGQLHRLKASCAFVGAAALLASVRGLQQAPADPQAHARFQSEAASLLSGPVPQS